MIEVSRLKDLNAAKLFLGFRIGAIRRRDFAVFPVQGQRGLRRLKRYFGDKMSVGAQMVVVLKAFVERCVSLVPRSSLRFSRLEVSQTDVFHPFLLVSCDSLFPVTQSRSSSFCYQIVVRETENRQLLYFLAPSEESVVTDAFASPGAPGSRRTLALTWAVTDTGWSSGV